jgi:hypothetical protein
MEQQRKLFTPKEAKGVWLSWTDVWGLQSSLLVSEPTPTSLIGARLRILRRYRTPTTDFLSCWRNSSLFGISIRRSEHIGIHETQQAALIQLAASEEKGEHRKRKAEVESNDGEAPKIKKKAEMDMTFVLGRAEIDPGDMSTQSPERNAEATTIEALETEVQALRERTEKNRDIIEVFFNAVNTLNNRLTKAEQLIQDNDRKQFGAITSLRADLNRTDGHVLALEAGKDRFNNSLIQLLNMLITPSDLA